MTIRIEPLARHPALIAVAAHWHFAEWGHADSGGSEDAWARQLAARAQSQGVPSYYIAFADDTAAGSVGLCDSDMSTRPELSPWLSGLFVLPQFRNRGIGGLLVRHAMAAARTAGVRTLFLHTARGERLYADHGWHPLARELYEGEQVCVMSTELSA